MTLKHPPKSINITKQDSNQLHVLDWRQHCTDHEAPYCLLLHGFMNNAHIWQPLAELLAGRYRLIGLDFRGHGDSSWDERHHYGHHHLIEDIITVIQQLNISQLHIVGHSLGARVGLLYTTQATATIHSLTIIDTGPTANNNGVAKVRQDAEAMQQSFADHNTYRRYLQRCYFFAQDSAIEAMTQHDLNVDENGHYRVKTDPAFTQALWKQGDNGEHRLAAPLSEQLWQALAAQERQQRPCHIIRGAISAILKKPIAEKMVQQVMPQAGQLTTIKHAGHAVICDQPEACCLAIAQFLDEHKHR
ncbi:pimeloyl-ACP methyl ester carboxylesterase [Sinobacterium caligoides]|uniref:Pimeloyl-ACP methyl ester carboxylesterase n=1 Tax=Sinobacterium caligoides TaxID=933926 RepID=A0A3N2DYK6_9GAMM|nr:alpha/beta hydrolase [Sinobacterium caligoides]ROS04931.1 pimeloyl-ACP methyl ester carboxylesterase [Sinobacterium caligoides]